MECTRAVLHTVRTLRTAAVLVAAALLTGGVLATSAAAGATTVHTALPERVGAANRAW